MTPLPKQIPPEETRMPDYNLLISLLSKGVFKFEGKVFNKASCRPFFSDNTLEWGELIQKAIEKNPDLIKDKKTLIFKGCSFSITTNFYFDENSNPINSIFFENCQFEFPLNFFKAQNPVFESCVLNDTMFATTIFKVKNPFIKNSVYKGRMLFDHCEFEEGLSIEKSDFKEIIKFNHCNFEKDFWLEDNVFNKYLVISTKDNKTNNEFKGRAGIINCSFKHSVIISRCHFEKEFIFASPIIETVILFDSVKFDKIGLFRNLQLSNRAKFLNTDMSNCSFLYSDFKDVYFSNCNLEDTLIDEKILLDNQFKQKAAKYSIWNLDKISTDDVLNELRSFEMNFDNVKDFERAGEFHKRRYELQRNSEKNLFKKFVLASYKWFSNYGEDYTKSLIWIICILFGFSFLYLITGLKYNDFTIYYLKPENINCFLNDWGCSMLYSLNSSVPFKKDLDFIKSANGWTTFFSMMQTLLQTIIGTLFVIALRRKFKR